MRVSNLQYVNSTRIDHRDLSFETFETSIAIEPASLSSDHFFVYDTFKFSVNSTCKQSTATANDNMKTLKLLAKENGLMKQVKRKMRHIINQGLQSRLTQDQTLSRSVDCQ